MSRFPGAEYLAALAAEAVLRALPEAVAVRAARRITRLIGCRTRFDRRMCENLAGTGYPPDDIRRIADGAWENLGHTAVNFVNLDRLQRHTQDIRVSGLEHLPEGGALVISAHSGFWEAIRIAARRAGRPLGLYYRRFNNPHIERRLRGALQGPGEVLLTKGASGTRQLIRTLNAGGRVLMLADQRISGAPELLFFGRPAPTSLVPAETALRCGVPIVPAFARRDGLGFHVRFEVPLSVDTPENMMQALLERTQAHIRSCPEEWLWMHSRWKRA